MNYLQNNQMTGTQAARPGQDSYNPFDAGIQKAISSARTSLGMTGQQEEAALRSSMLAFADSMAQQPREKGFLNNFAAIGRGLSPAIRAHDDAENAAFAQNNALANQILSYKAAEEQRLAQAEERLWHRQHAERQLGEQRRYHDMMNERMSQGRGQSQEIPQEKHADSSSSELSNILNSAEKFLTEDLEKQETYRGRASNFLSGWTPGGYIPTKQQAQVNAMGDILRGKLFNTWGYRNQAEFEHVPSISADNPPEVNLEIIKTLKNLLGEGTPQIGMETKQFPTQQNLNQGIDTQLQSISMRDQNGNQYMIPVDEVEGALGDGLILIEGQ